MLPVSRCVSLHYRDRLCRDNPAQERLLPVVSLDPSTSGVYTYGMSEALLAGLEVFKTAADFAAAARKQAIQKVRYSHDAMIDMIVGNPWISQGELAENFGYTEGWVSQVIASDAFQARLAQRKDALIDPHIRATLEERFKGLVARSLDILMAKLERPAKDIPDELALKALEVASKAAGYGAKGPGVVLQQNFVALVPQKAVSSAAWAEQLGVGGSPVVHSPSAKVAQTIDAEVLVEPGPAAPNTQGLLAALKAG